MKEAADREDRTEKNAVTPGPIAPAREQLGYMLLQSQRAPDALVAFEATLKKEPNRFLALAGASEAARQTGDLDASRRYAEQLLAVTSRGDDGARPQRTAAALLVKTRH
jgi:Tfp pilus assembly protein PilF